MSNSLFPPSDKGPSFQIHKALKKFYNTVKNPSNLRRTKQTIHGNILQLAKKHLKNVLTISDHQGNAHNNDYHTAMRMA